MNLLPARTLLAACVVTRGLLASAPAQSLLNGLQLVSKEVPENQDSDGDGVTDREELRRGTNPFVADSNGNGLPPDPENTPSNTVPFTAYGLNLVLPRLANSNIIAATISGHGPVVMAIQINDPDFSAATWLPFSTNILINLGSEDGPRDVWFGFQDASGAEFHLCRKIVLDAAPPRLSLVTPLHEIVTTPYLQVKGYCTKPLQRISYALVNANGTFADQDAFITRQEFNPHTVHLAPIISNASTCLWPMAPIRFR